MISTPEGCCLCSEASSVHCLDQGARQTSLAIIKVQVKSLVVSDFFFQDRHEDVELLERMNACSKDHSTIEYHFLEMLPWPD